MLGGVGWRLDPREGRERCLQPLDGDGSSPIGRGAGGRIEQRVGLSWLWRAVRSWGMEIAPEVWFGFFFSFAFLVGNGLSAMVGLT